PAALLVNTPEEQSLIARRFPSHAPAQVVGVGVSSPAGNAARFREQYGIKEPFLLYLGRIDEGKGVRELIRMYGALRRRTPQAPPLLLAGRGELRLRGQGIRVLGPLSEADKHDALAAAFAVVNPSPLESLSLVTLEAFAQGTPVL